MKVKSEPCSHLNGYCVEEQRRIQKSAKHLRWSFYRKFEGEHYCISLLLKLVKRKNPHGCFQKPAAFPANFHKMLAENHCDCGQIRS